MRAPDRNLPEETAPPPARTLVPPARMTDLLSLKPSGDDRFTGWCHAGRGPVIFGGHVAAHAVLAAGRTVGVDGDPLDDDPAPSRVAHSLHMQFLRAGDPRRPVEYVVERLRDGSSYDARRVTAEQGGRAVFTLSASFKSPEDGPSRQPAMPDVPSPEELPNPYPRWRQLDPDDFEKAWQNRVLETRYTPDPWSRAEESGTNQLVIWLKVTGPLPANPLAHAAALTYASDLGMASTAALDVEPPRAIRGGPGRTRLASLDHSVWLHRPVRADGWLLFANSSPTAADGRGFSTSQVWDRSGRLVASLAQELMVRPV